MCNVITETDDVDDGGVTCLFLKKVDSIYTLKINTSISVRNPLTFISMKADSFSLNG